METGIGGLITLAVLILRLWLENESAKEKKFNDTKKAISDAVASGDLSRINGIVQQLVRR